MPGSQSSLHKLLLSDDSDDALDKQLQDSLVSSLWPSWKNGDNSAYFVYFKHECETWMRSGIYIAIETYQDFINLTFHLKNNRTSPRNSSSILAFFPSENEKRPSFAQSNTPDVTNLPLKDRPRDCDRNAIEGSIFLTVRLWLMLNASSSLTEDIVQPGRLKLDWPEDQSLDDFITTHFPKSDLGPKVSQWPSSVHGHSLERIGGFDIAWTDHLGNHLYLDEDTDTISIYHHVHFLQGLQTKKASEDVLPDRLLLETLQSLALLIPRAKRDSKAWFDRARTESTTFIDKHAGDVPQDPSWARSPENYKYWGQRLIAIKEAYDASEPKDLGQWWHDRRRKVQWYTFWVAILVLILTIVFGLIQSVTGIMQVYYTTHPVQQPS
ncbi:hypothetical protein ACLMJK_008024 [Lecanora helva]